jgi:hypothetical protein
MHAHFYLDSLTTAYAKQPLPSGHSVPIHDVPARARTSPYHDGFEFVSTTSSQPLMHLLQKVYRYRLPCTLETKPRCELVGKWYR